MWVFPPHLCLQFFSIVVVFSVASWGLSYLPLDFLFHAAVDGSTNYILQTIHGKYTEMLLTFAFGSRMLWYNSPILVISESCIWGICVVVCLRLLPFPGRTSNSAWRSERGRKWRRMRCHGGKHWKGISLVGSLGQAFFPRGSDSLDLEWIPGTTTVFNPHSSHFLLEFGPQMDFLSRTKFSPHPPCQTVFCLRHFSLHHSFISVCPKSTSCGPFLHPSCFPHPSHSQALSSRHKT